MGTMCNNMLIEILFSIRFLMIESLVCGLFSNYNQSFLPWSHFGNTSLPLFLDLWQIISSVQIQKYFYWIILIKNCFKDYTNSCFIPRLGSISYRRELSLLYQLINQWVLILCLCQVICYYWEWTDIFIMSSTYDHLLWNFL